MSMVRPAAMVVSHERSGTHFLMNSLAACYGYSVQPWTNFDGLQVNINYFAPPLVAETLLSLAVHHGTRVVKSHHAVGFFGDLLPAITERYVVFYIYRDPAAVMLSMWRFLHSLRWFEGPKVHDATSLASGPPGGRLMRYQMEQYPTMLHRWAAHVGGWRAAAEACPRIVLVRYEDLDGDYARTMAAFASHLGPPSSTDFLRPARDVNIVPGGGPHLTGLEQVTQLESLRAQCRTMVGATMARLGY